MCPSPGHSEIILLLLSSLLCFAEWGAVLASLQVASQDVCLAEWSEDGQPVAQHDCG
jgi:hypothetical protein